MRTKIEREVEVVGPSDFIERVQDALSLIKRHAPEYHSEISKYIGRIAEAPPPPTRLSGMAAFETPPTYYLGRKTAFFSLEWCASCIAHDAYHSKLYHDFVDANPGVLVPDDVWGGPEIELQCNQYQIEVGKLIGLPQSDIERLEGLDGSHALLDEIDW